MIWRKKGYILVNSENEEEIITKIRLKFDFDKIEVLKWKNHILNFCHIAHGYCF